MTRVRNTKACKLKFEQDFKDGLFTSEDGKVLNLWTTEMEQLGPDFVRLNPEWGDHALDREWQGYRASCFSLSGRIIYRILSHDEIEVCEVERITPNHDYK